VGAEDRDRLARLHQQGLVVFGGPDDRTMARKAPHDRAAFPLSGWRIWSSTEGPDLGVEVVHEDPKRGFLQPAFAGDLRAARVRGPACRSRACPPHDT
jgi:hypothetical protein